VRFTVGIDRPDGLGRVAECRVVRIDLDHRQYGGERFLEGEPITQLLLDEVSDHALGLCAQHVERGIGHLSVRGFLERQQSDLWTVSV
jgi:hypothetical protein